MENEQPKENKIIIDDTNACSYFVTPHLRYKMKETIDGPFCKSELCLQQMWQGSDGSQKWEWVETAE